MASIVTAIGSYGKGIVRDSSLILFYDTALSQCYPGSGTKLTDLSGYSNQSNTANGPVFNTTGYFTFDGSTQYIQVNSTLATNTKNCTIVMWINSTATQASYTGLFFNRLGANVCGMDYIGTSNLGWHWKDDSTTYLYNTGLVIPTNTWVMIALSIGTTSTTFWLNGTSNTQTYTTANQTFSNVTIGQDNIGGRFFKGQIGQVLFYNKTLSAAEIQQNYNAGRSRFGI